MQRLILAALLISLLFGAGFALAQDATPEAAAASANTSQTTTTDQANTGLNTALRHLHSFVRWVVILVTVAAVIKLGLGLAQNADYDPLTRRIMLAFSISITLQWVVGLVFLIAYGSIVGFGLRHFWEHAAVMTVAVALSHMHNRWKNADSRIRYRNSLLIVVVVLVLVVIGVSLLPFNAWHLAPGM